MSKFYIDTEFSEDGYKRIDLISIAVVRDDGAERYYVAKDGWSPDQCNDWVKANVLPKLDGCPRTTRIRWCACPS